MIPHRPNFRRRLFVGLWCASVLGLGAGAWAADPTLQDLAERNRILEQQVKEQQRLIDELRAKVDDVLKTSDRHDRQLHDLQSAADVTPPDSGVGHSDHEVRVSGEAGLAWFSGGTGSQFPNSEFRVDDAKIFIEAPVIKNVYFYSELDLFTRETADENFHLGEMYVDFENVSRLWGMDRLLSFRMGRINIPFGEEYQTRGVVENPLITHSLSDIWGIDEGAEIYGEIGRFQYVLGVQNGSHPVLRDYDGDKAYVGRIGVDPTRWLHLSASMLRTGNLSVVNDKMSEAWLATGFIRPLGAAATTQVFYADFYEADAALRWRQGHLSGMTGWINYGDDDRAANNSRSLRYHSVELVQDVVENLYAAARWSAIDTSRGYPLAGLGNPGTYFYSGLQAKDLHRLSLGLGYRFGPPLIWKVEYSFEGGRMVNGQPRDQEDLLSTEIAMKF